MYTNKPEIIAAKASTQVPFQPTYLQNVIRSSVETVMSIDFIGVYELVGSCLELAIVFASGGTVPWGRTPGFGFGRLEHGRWVGRLVTKLSLLILT